MKRLENYSCAINLTRGVPQEAILPPLLFGIFYKKKKVLIKKNANFF